MLSKEKSEGFANQTFRLLLVGRSRSGFSSPDSDTYYTLGLAVETITESSMNKLSGFLKTINEVVKVERGEGQDDKIAKYEKQTKALP